MTRPPTFTAHAPTTVPPTEPPRDWTDADMGLHLSDRACAAIIALRAEGRSTLGWSESDLEAYHRSHLATAKEKADAELYDAHDRIARLKAENRAAQERWLNSLTTDGHAYRRAVDEAEVVGEAMRRAEAECAALRAASERWAKTVGELRAENADLRERLGHKAQADAERHSQGERERNLFPVGTRVRHRAGGVAGTVIATAPVSVEWDNGPCARITNALGILVVSRDKAPAPHPDAECPHGTEGAARDPAVCSACVARLQEIDVPAPQPAAPADWRAGDLAELDDGALLWVVMSAEAGSVRARCVKGSLGRNIAVSRLRRPPLAVGQWVRHVEADDYGFAAGRVEHILARDRAVVRQANGRSFGYTASKLIPIAPPAGGA